MGFRNPLAANPVQLLSGGAVGISPPVPGQLYQPTGIDLLFATATDSLNFGVVHTGTLLAVYSEIVVLVYSVHTNGVTAAVNIRTAAGAHALQLNQVHGYGYAGGPLEYHFPLANNIGDTWVASITADTANAAADVAVLVYGVKGAPSNVRRRSDGRSTPLNSFAAWGTTPNGVGYLVGPPSSSRIMLGSFTIDAVTGNTGLFGQLSVTIAGLAVNIATVWWEQVIALVYPDGLLLDQGTGVVIAGNAASSAYAACTYDLVAL
jgi:hypothetical protein